MASTVALKVRPGMESSCISTVWRRRSLFWNRSGNRKSTYMLPMSSRLTRSAPSLTKSPRLMLRMPTVPSKGAMIAMRDKRAHESANWASVTCRLAALSSSTRWATKFWATSSWLRLKLASAIDTCALACLISARCRVSSNCTSNWPLRTTAPSEKPISRTRPGTSGRIITLWRERSEPTDCASSRKLTRSTLATSTPAALGAEAEAAGPDAPTEGGAAPLAVISLGPWGFDWYHHAAPEAAAIPSTATTE